MIAIKSERIWYFDVDSTLVMWDQRGSLSVTCPYTGDTLYGHAHLSNIRLLKEQFYRDTTIVVWSQGGWQHAMAVVRALNLEAYVSYVQTKPTGIVDDLDPALWLPHHIYLPFEKKYKGA